MRVMINGRIEVGTVQNREVRTVQAVLPPNNLGEIAEVQLRQLADGSLVAAIFGDVRLERAKSQHANTWNLRIWPVAKS